MEKEKLVSLVTKAQQGDTDALNSLFNEFYNDVYYFALKTVKDDNLACDITQETFVEIISTIGNLKEPAAFITWMKQITYHQCTRYFKKKKDVIVDEDEDGNTVFDTLQEENAEFIPDEALDREDFKKTIMAILDELSEEQRSATMMFYFDELSVKQIAEIQGVSEGTVKSRLNYARKAIKNSVEEYEKKNGIKLHAIPFFPFFKWLFEGSFTGGMPLASAKIVAEGVTVATGTTVTVATATTTATAVATTTAVGIGAKIAALPLVIKIIAGVVAASVAIGGVAAVILTRNNDEKAPANNQSVISQNDNPSSKPANNQETSKHEHEWSEWDVEEQKYGVITYDIKNRKCASCEACETVNEIENAYEFMEKHFGELREVTYDYFSMLMPEFSSDGKFDANGLLRVGNRLAWENRTDTASMEVEISADEYYENLKKYFVLDDAIISEMKAIRPEKTYKFMYDFNGTFLDFGICKYMGGNIYEIYTTYAGSHASNYPFFTVEVEYNLHTGGDNKILSIKMDDELFYEPSRRANKTVSLESLISNVTEKATDFSGYTTGDNFSTASDIEETYELITAMDLFGYNLTKEEMRNKFWGAVDIETTNDTVNSITAYFEFPLFQPGHGFYGSDDVVRTNREAAKTDIERFVNLVGQENIKVRITEDNIPGEKGLQDITDEVIDGIVKQWSNTKEHNIYIYTAEPITVNGKKCNLSITISGSGCMVETAYNMSFNISFL